MMYDVWWCMMYDVWCMMYCMVVSCVDCNNNGICDTSTGICQCFNGFFGESCNQSEHFYSITSQ